MKAYGKEEPRDLQEKVLAVIKAESELHGSGGSDRQDNGGNDSTGGRGGKEGQER